MKLIIDIDIVNYNVCRIGGEDFGPVQQAVGKGIPLEDIKTEINSSYLKSEKEYDKGRNDGLFMAIQIIEKHIGGEENEE